MRSSLITSGLRSRFVLTAAFVVVHTHPLEMEEVFGPSPNNGEHQIEQTSDVEVNPTNITTAYPNVGNTTAVPLPQNSTFSSLTTNNSPTTVNTTVARTTVPTTVPTTTAQTTGPTTGHRTTYHPINHPTTTTPAHSRMASQRPTAMFVGLSCLVGIILLTMCYVHRKSAKNDHLGDFELVPKTEDMDILLQHPHTVAGSSYRNKSRINSLYRQPPNVPDTILEEEGIPEDEDPFTSRKWELKRNNTSSGSFKMFGGAYGSGRSSAASSIYEDEQDEHIDFGGPV